MEFPLVVRKVTKNKWERERRPVWLAEGEVSADVFPDIRTQNGGSLSIWIADKQEQIHEICLAIACTSTSLAELDYVAVEYKWLSDAEFNFENQDGKTPYHSINHLHRNLVRLSVYKLAELATIFSVHGVFDRIPEKTVQNLILERVKNNLIERSEIAIETQRFRMKLDEIQKRA